MNNVMPLKKKGGAKAAGSTKAATGGDGGAAPGEARAERTVPWSGNFSGEELERPGGLLLAALVQHCLEQGKMLTEMAVELGITYGYINQLRNGNRATDTISDAFATSCAKYLGVPLLTVLMLAGRLKPEHAFESEEMLATEIPRAMKYICDDHEWGPLMTGRIRKLDLNSLFTIVRLYEKATGKSLLPNQLDPKTVATHVMNLQKLQQSREATVVAMQQRNKREANTSE